MAAVALVTLSVGTGTALQFVKGDLLDAAIGGKSAEALRLGLLLLAMILLETLGCYGFGKLGAELSVKCTWQLKADLFGEMLKRRYVDFRRQPQGGALSKYVNDADMVRDRYFSAVVEFAYLLFRVALVSAALLMLDVPLALVTLTLLGMPLFVPKLLEARLQSAQREQAAALERLLAKVTNWLSAFELIKNYGLERKILARYADASAAAERSNLRVQRLSNVNRLLSSLMPYGAYFIVLALAARCVLSGRFSAGDFFVAIGMVDQLSYPLVALSGYIAGFRAVKPIADALLEPLDDSGAQDEGADGPHELKREIEFEDVCFAYEQGRPLLSNFSLVLRRGGKYLITGPSGCGKSTLLNLLLRYYDPANGEIRLDGVPIGRWADLYDLASVVRQDASLLNDTLRNNLTLYDPMPDERLAEVLRALGLQRLANVGALDQMVAEGGANFSGGERRRICLARALLRRRPLLLLDEPLANLDDATAAAIEDLLLSIDDCTMVIVSHQFSERKRDAFDAVISMG